MRFEHRFCLLPFVVLAQPGYGSSVELFAFRRALSVCVNIEYLIEAQSREKVVAAMAAMDDVEMTVTKFL
jgi:hypothetical protein